ncbi:uncharacterized protein LOC123508525 [Portunus trituberculatus]|uniref:uncharacterized protein LOC123508525 n=1 Tax=Portunus trituberculatus TaxID=210409 RepID=UPI001E1CB4AE|nr:uncharacterized protein LOC123508525 [Portunus trituberculatus]
MWEGGGGGRVEEARGWRAVSGVVFTQVCKSNEIWCFCSGVKSTDVFSKSWEVNAYLYVWEAEAARGSITLWGESEQGGQGGQGEQGEGIKVFSLQREATKKTTDDVFLRYNFSRDARTTDALTLCYWVSEAEWPLPGVVVPEVWYHACHLLDARSYTFYWQARQVPPQQSARQPPPVNTHAQHEEEYRGRPHGRWPFLMNGTVILGQEQDDVGGNFDATQVTRGDITQVYMWGRLLEPAAVRRLASCGTPDAQDVLFSTDTSQVEVFGGVESRLPPSSLCRDQPFYAILPEERSLQASLAVCQAMDGKLVLPTSESENARLTQQMVPFSDVCVPTAVWKLWLGARLTAAGWSTIPAGAPLTYHNFRPAININSSVFGCAELRLDGYWEPDYCKSKRCTACSFVRTSYLHFRGLCFDKELEARFRVVGSPERRPVFWSHQGLLIVWRDNLSRWQMEDPNINATLLWRLGVGSDYPLGRQRWRLAREMCGQQEGHTLHASLSRCAAEEFTCSTGECIAPHLRCNFHYDCPDNSDEVSCTMVEASNDALLKQVPPPPLKSFEGDILQLESSITLTRVAAVDDLNMAITLEFKLTLTWSDHRVNFRHLGGTRQGVMLTEEDSGRLWRPLLRVANLDGGRLEELGRRFLAQAVAPPTRPPSMTST